MTPKEKALELINRHLSVYDIIPIAQECALITADEILEVLQIPEQNIEREYWHEIKYEIENIDPDILW